MNTSNKTYLSPPESVKGLWYDPFTNRFEDESGAILHDLGPYFHTWVLDQWKKTKKYGLIRDRKGEYWEIHYNLTNQYHKCRHHCHECSVRCDVYDYFRDW